MTAGRSADMISNGFIEISRPNNPKIDTHICWLAAGDSWPADLYTNGNIEITPKSTPITIYLSTLEFWCDGVRRVTLSQWLGRWTRNLMALSKSPAQITPKSTPIMIYLSYPLNFDVTAGGGVGGGRSPVITGLEYS